MGGVKSSRGGGGASVRTRPHRDSTVASLDAFSSARFEYCTMLAPRRRETRAPLAPRGSGRCNHGPGGCLVECRGLLDAFRRGQPRRRLRNADGQTFRIVAGDARALQIVDGSPPKVVRTTRRGGSCPSAGAGGTVRPQRPRFPPSWSDTRGMTRPVCRWRAKALTPSHPASSRREDLPRCDRRGRGETGPATAHHRGRSAALGFSLRVNRYGVTPNPSHWRRPSIE